jgi:hypothetical protein
MLWALIIISATSRLGRAQRNPTISEPLLGFAMLNPTYMDSAGRNDDHCHAVFDSGSADSGAEVVAHLAVVVFVELSVEERGEVPPY